MKITSSEGLKGIPQLLSEIQRRPVIGSIFADSEFSKLKSQILFDNSCPRKEQIRNHDIVILGYNFPMHSPPYFLVLNSYGLEWGVAGIGKVHIDSHNFGLGGVGYILPIGKHLQ